MKMESSSMNDFDNISKNFAISAVCMCVCATFAKRFSHITNNTKYDYDHEKGI